MNSFDSGLLIRLRLKLNLTQTQLAELVGVDQSSLNRWEAGISEPKTKSVLIFADIFKVDFKEFYKNTPPPKTK